MKKLLLLFAISFVTTLAFSQHQPKPFSTGSDEPVVTTSRGGELDCSGNSIFSQSPVNSNNGYYSDNGTLYNAQNLFENFSGLTEWIGGITFWGYMYDGGDCYVAGSQDFEITFFQDNAGAVGTQVQTFTVTVTPTETGSYFNGASILRYDVTFSSAVSLSDGWVSVVKLNPGNNDCEFAWLNTINGDDLIAYNHNGGTPVYYTENMSFCLTGQPPVPVSNWALILGVFLIAVFMVVRYKRQMA
ncbi:MAG: hypothetical protein DRJ09_03770 [Bacteroidetes bacterium]|nr:MAG: hypothetical protein DRJ09_03770 [Bacteroidota bacterium]